MESVGKHSGADVAEFMDKTLDSKVALLHDGLKALFEIHQFTSGMVFHNGEVLSNVLNDKDVLRTYVLALYVELGEFIQELDWKPWRSRTKEISEFKIGDEFADILAFVGVLLTILDARGISPEMLAESYRTKELENMRRFTVEQIKMNVTQKT